MADISLLPEDLRGQEEQIKTRQTDSTEEAGNGLKMHVPAAMVDEDIEIIEVDEGDLAAVLSDEPFMTRVTYKLSLWIDRLKDQFFKHEEEAPPAKAPPQFFRPPKKGLVTSLPSSIPQGSASASPHLAAKAGAGMAGSSALEGKGDKGGIRARITPQSEVPRRVRVIKRVRKPVRVSLISAEDLAVLTIDVAKRKWTLTVFIILFAAIIVGGYFFISSRLQVSKDRLATVEADSSAIQKEATTKLEQWKQYEDLEGRLKLLQQALGGHVMITRLFDFLEKNTLSGVSYKNASWSGSGQLSLDVVANSFDDTGGQLIVFKRSPLVESAESSGFTMERNATTGEVEHIVFQIALKLKPEALQGLGLESDQMPSASSTNMEATTSTPTLP